LGILNSRWFRLLVSFGLLTLVIRLADWQAIANVLRHADPKWVAAAVGCAVVDRLLLNYRWQVLLTARHLLIRFVPLLRIQFAANFLGSFLPSSIGVDAIRIAALCRAGMPAPEVIASTLVDRATIALASLLFGAAMVLALAGTRLPGELQSWVLGTAVAACLACIVVVQPRVRRWARDRVFAHLPERVRGISTDVASAMLAYRHQYGALARTALLTAIIFAVRILFAKALALACGASVTIVDLLLVIPILWVIVMVPITVGGIGLQDAGYVALMALVGVPPAIAVSMSLIEHVVARLVVLPGALFVADVAGIRTAASATRAPAIPPVPERE
jgi:uncharacterized protein (TIRG00374 family)